MFTPIKIGDKTLKHRVVLPPLTRGRADVGMIPNDLMAEHYRQRASDGGLILSESVIICPQGIFGHLVPGIFTDEQIQAWKKITSAVHEKNGLISIQLWHPGRCAHSSFNQHPLVAEAHTTVCEAPSAIPMEKPQYSFHNTLEAPTMPHVLSIEDILRVRQQFVTAAKNAIEVAGFDYIELQASNGFLFEQFMNDGTNTRTDQYGGSLDNRMRFLQEVLRDVIAAVGADKVGIRISPHGSEGTNMEITDSDPDSVYTKVFECLNEFHLAYVIVSEKYDFKPTSDAGETVTFYKKFAHLYKNGPIIGANGFKPHTAMKLLNVTTKIVANPDNISCSLENKSVNVEKKENTENEENSIEYGSTIDTRGYDVIAFGRLFISNPDLPFRLEHKLPLTQFVSKTFYAPGPDGYTDYPTFEEQVQATVGGKVEDVINSPELQAQMIEKSQNMKYKLVPFY